MSAPVKPGLESTVPQDSNHNKIVYSDGFEINRFIEAIKSKNAQVIQECLKYFTTFPEGALSEALDRYLKVFILFQVNNLSEYNNHLHEALYPFLIKDPQCSATLGCYLANDQNKELHASFFFECAIYLNDAQLLLEVVDAVNQVGIYAKRETWNLYFDILENACASLETALIKSAHSLFIKKDRSIGYEFNLDYCFSKFRD